MKSQRSEKSWFYQAGLGIVILTLFAFTGCGGSGGDGGSSDNQTPVADISVNKTQIALGDVVVDGSSEETISIQNVGAAGLSIGQIAGANVLSAPFSISADSCSGKQLAPSQTCTLQVRFSPATQGGSSDTFDIPSNDPVKNPVTVTVSGYGLMINASINQFFADSCPKGKLLVTVTDKDGNPLTGLTKDAFSLSEKGVAKNIESISQATSPISAALVLDYSGSMQACCIPQMEEAAKAFVDQLDPLKPDMGAIIKYASLIRLTQDFTSDHALLKAGIDKPYEGEDQTALYEATWFATEETAGEPNRRAVVIITDGQDDRYTRTLNEVIDNAKSKGVPLFTIGLGLVDELVLKRMADETGGRYFHAPAAKDLKAIYLQVAEILAGQYIIEYTSSGGGTALISLGVTHNTWEGRVSKTLAVCP